MERKRLTTNVFEYNNMTQTVRARVKDFSKSDAGVFMPKYDAKVDLTKIPAQLQRPLMAQGVEKIGRAAMNLGANATLDNKFEAIRKAFAWLENPKAATLEPDAKRTTDSSTTLLVAALMRQNPGADEDGFRNLVEGWSEDKRIAYLARADIRKIVDAINAERTATVDMNELEAQITALKGKVPTVKAA